MFSRSIAPKASKVGTKLLRLVMSLANLIVIYSIEDFSKSLTSFEITSYARRNDLCYRITKLIN